MNSIIDISDELGESLKRASNLSGRTIEEQLEFWSRLGMLADEQLSNSDIQEVLKGTSKLIIE